MDDGQRRFDVGVEQVGKAAADLSGSQHALVDQRARREADHEDARRAERRQGVDRRFEALANDEQLALEGAVVLVAAMPRAASDEHLPEHGSGVERLASKAAKVRGYIAPSEEHLPFFADDLLEQ